MPDLSVVPAPDSEPLTFEDFWLIFPRRVAKFDAKKAWAKIPPAKHGAILSALIDWERVWRARGEIEYVPFPATWLNGERWEDELPRAMQSTHASHVLTTPMHAGERTPIPDKVRAMLAKMRAK